MLARLVYLVFWKPYPKYFQDEQMNIYFLNPNMEKKYIISHLTFQAARPCITLSTFYVDWRWSLKSDTKVPTLMLNSHYTQTNNILDSKLSTHTHLYIHGSLQSNTVRSVQGQRGLFLFPGHDRGWWLMVIDSWMFGLGCHLWGFTIGKAFIHIQYRTLARSLTHTDL